MLIFNQILIFILGLCVGSFLNVVIDRLPQGRSISRGRSYCDYCKHKLVWYDLIPVISFFLLDRKCRFCYKKISWQYPIVELITGFSFFFVFHFLIIHYQLTTINYLLFFTYYVIIVSCLIAIFFTDLKYRIIPDQILLIMAVINGLFIFLFNRNVIFDHLVAGLVLFFIFGCLVVFTRGRGMGLGDVKYAAVSGFILGTVASVVSFYLSFLTGAVVSLILIVIGRKKFSNTIPFGPFLVLATVIAYICGDLLWSFFRGIIGI